VAKSCLILQDPITQNRYVGLIRQIIFIFKYINKSLKILIKHISSLFIQIDSLGTGLVWETVNEVMYRKILARQQRKVCRLKTTFSGGGRPTKLTVAKGFETK
jgi:general stress protein CsbA